MAEPAAAERRRAGVFRRERHGGRGTDGPLFLERAVSFPEYQHRSHATFTSGAGAGGGGGGGGRGPGGLDAPERDRPRPPA